MKRLIFLTLASGLMFRTKPDDDGAPGGDDELGGGVAPGENFVTQTGAHGPIDNVDPSIKPNDAAAPAGADMASVVARLEELSMKVGAQEEELIRLRANNLETDLAAKPKKLSIPDKPVKHEKKSYQWNVASFRHTDGTVYTAEEVSTDKDMLKAILDIPGQGLLRELV